MDTDKRCGAVITDRNLEYMIVIRENSYPLHLRRWGLPKGKAKRGETPDDCVVREIREEIGLNLARTPHSKKGGGNWAQVLILNGVPSDYVLRKSSEVETVLWMKLTEVRAWLAREPGAFNKFIKDRSGDIGRIIRIREERR